MGGGDSPWTGPQYGTVRYMNELIQNPDKIDCRTLAGAFHVYSYTCIEYECRFEFEIEYSSAVTINYENERRTCARALLYPEGIAPELILYYRIIRKRIIPEDMVQSRVYSVLA